MSKSKKHVQLKRFKPFRRVFLPHKGERSDESAFIRATFDGGFADAKELGRWVDSDLISVDVLLNRVKEIVEEKRLPDRSSFPGVDYATGYNKVSKYLDCCIEFSENGENEKLLVALVALGYEMGTFDLNDMAMRGLESFRAPHRKSERGVAKRREIPDTRYQAYLVLFRRMSSQGIESTYKKVLLFLKAQAGHEFLTENDACPRIYVSKNTLMDDFGELTPNQFSLLRKRYQADAK